MNTSSGSAECALISWGIAALVAVVAFAMLMLLGGWTFMQAAFVGAIVLVLGGIGMMWAFCRPLPGPNEVTLEKVTAPVASAAPAPAPAPAPAQPS
ncbi:MAG: hypothetical protein JJU19_12690, partial [Pararhodobacter sp.]|nr:hypothetical protein [Pararhodobacter sp.]